MIFFWGRPARTRITRHMPRKACHVWPAHTAAGEVFKNEKKLDFFERKWEGELSKEFRRREAEGEGEGEGHALLS